MLRSRISIADQRPPIHPLCEQLFAHCSLDRSSFLIPRPTAAEVETVAETVVEVETVAETVVGVETVAVAAAVMAVAAMVAVVPMAEMRPLPQQLRMPPRLPMLQPQMLRSVP